MLYYQNSDYYAQVHIYRSLIHIISLTAPILLFTIYPVPCLFLASSPPYLIEKLDLTLLPRSFSKSLHVTKFPATPPFSSKSGPSHYSLFFSRASSPKKPQYWTVAERNPSRTAKKSITVHCLVGGERGSVGRCSYGHWRFSSNCNSTKTRERKRKNRERCKVDSMRWKDHRAGGNYIFSVARFCTYL